LGFRSGKGWLESISDRLRFWDKALGKELDKPLNKALERMERIRVEVDKLQEMKRMAFEMKNWKEVKRINKMIEFSASASGLVSATRQARQTGRRIRRR